MMNDISKLLQEAQHEHRHSGFEAVQSGAANACPICQAFEIQQLKRQITAARIEELEWALQQLNNISGHPKHAGTGIVNSTSNVIRRIQQLKTGGDETCPKTQSETSQKTSGSPAPEVTNGASDLAFYKQSLERVAKEFDITTPLILVACAETIEETYVDVLLKVIRRIRTKERQEHWHRGMTEAADIAGGVYPHQSRHLCKSAILAARDKKP